MKRGKKEIKAVIFDIGGVLQLSKQPEKLVLDKHLKSLPQNCKHRHKGVHDYASTKLGISLDQYFDSIDSVYADSIEGKISEKEALGTMAKNLRISVKKLRKIFIKAYRNNFKFNKKLFKQALKLKKRGHKIAILSDQWYISKEALLNSELRKNFNLVIISCDVGIRKPNPKIYRLILKKLKIPARNCLFIDNQQWNIKPAKKLGMKTILFKNNKQIILDLENLMK